MLDVATRWLLNPAGLTQHFWRLSREPGLLWLHILTDIGIGIGYLTISLSLLALALGRPDLVLRPVMALFGAVTMLCGIDRWLDLLTLWIPVDGTEGLVEAVTAVLAIATAIMMIRHRPGLLALPSSGGLRRVDARMEEVKHNKDALAIVAHDAADALDKRAGERAGTMPAEQESPASEARHRLLAETLKEAYSRLSLATDRGGIGIWDWDIVNDKMSWDPWMFRLYGEEPRQDSDANEIWRRHLHPDDRDRVEAAVAAAVKGGEPFHTRFRITWDDGSIHYIEGTAPRVIRDANGRAVRMVGTNTDVSERQIEAEQRAIMIEAAPHGMLIVDEIDTITLANQQAEKLFGYPPGGLHGQPLEILVPEGFRNAHRQLRSDFTEARTSRTMATGQDFIGRKRDGSPVTLEVMLNPVKTPRGRVTVVSVIDSAERKRKLDEKLEVERNNRLMVEAANAELERVSQHLVEARDRADQANRAKSRFLASMSHELRTPLNGILGYAQLLHMDGGLNPVQAARVDAMLAAGKHLLEMITCVLDLSEIEANHIELQAVRFDVPSVVEACLDLIRPMTKTKGLSLAMKVAADVRRELVADRTRFRQVLLNLLGNAAKFTARGGIEVRVRPGATGSTIVLEVVDTGAGIPVDQRQRLFKDFERLDTEVTHAAEGTGLGLALSARLAILMGGRLGYTENPAGGSIFWLELPLNTPATSQPDRQSAESQEATPSPSPLPERSLRVLVVDDMPMNRDIAKAFLNSAGHEVMCTDNGADAVKQAAGEDFDVIVMDVRMPQMDGFEATRRIRAIEGRRGKVPILALTAHAFGEQVRECHEAGMNSHLAKPFDRESLLLAIGHTIAANQQAADSLQSNVPTVATNEAETPSIDKECPVLDRDAFNRIAALIPPQKLGGYTQTIASHGEALLRDLSEIGAITRRSNELADAAHALAGIAALLGFERVATAGRNFERVLLSNPPEAQPLVEELRAAVRATLSEIASLDLPTPPTPTDAGPSITDHQSM